MDINTARVILAVTMVIAGTALVITNHDGWVVLPIIGFILALSD